MLVFDQINKEDRHLRLLAVGLLAGLLVLLAGLWYVQVISTKRHQEDLLNQSFRSVRLPAVRGKILDRNLVPLAENHPSYNIDLYLAELSKNFQDEYRRLRPPGKLTRAERDTLERQARVQVVSNIVLRVSTSLDQSRAFNERQFLRHYEEIRALPFPILENLQPVQIARFVERSAKEPGVELEIQPVRVYPGVTSLAHLLGYMRRDDSSTADEEAFFNYRLPDFKGETGLEAAFDSALRGKAGGKTMMVNRLGYRQAETLQSVSEPGQNVVLTIDSGIQQAAERALSSAYGTNTRGAAVVMDAQNGDVLAMASAPAYDPGTFLGRISHEEWARLTDAKMRPLINRAMHENYAPGSIFKIVVGLAALEQGVLEPTNFVHNPGYYMLGRRRIDDRAAPGDYDFRRAFSHSSNTYFIYHGLKPGVLQKVLTLGRQLHLGERCDLLPRQEAAGHFPDGQSLALGWQPGDTANLSIGQGAISVTPLQMAVMTAAVANGGKVYWPRLVDRIESAETGDGEPPTYFPAGRLRDELSVSASNLQIIRQAMLADVEDRGGTGSAAAVPGLHIGGKTGTAEIEHNGRIVDKNAWFVSFAPVENPRYVVVVMVESGASGGKTCAPIARQIYQAIQKRFSPPIAAVTPGVK